MYQFTDDCMINIELIDNEHRKLFDVINEAISLVEKTDDVEPIFNNLLSTLKDYASTHFAHEEEYMKSINDPELALQQREHRAFTKKVNEFSLDTSSKEAAKKSLNDLLLYLVKWLYHHILSSDIMIGKIKSNDNPFEFTKKYMTDIKLIDDEHRRLFEIIKDTNDVIHADYLHDKYDEIMRLLNDLKEYTTLHFSDEEHLMEKINYPYLDSQKQAHAAFIERLVTIDFDTLNDIDDNQDEYLTDLIDFLLNWLSNHILASDKKIGEYMKANNLLHE